MHKPDDSEVMNLLVMMMSDAFNRSLNALDRAGVLDAKKLRGHYKGVGSKYYDIVTEQIVLTARLGVPGLRRTFQADDEVPETE